MPRQRSRSSGCIPEVQPLPSSCSQVRPVKSSQHLLRKVHSLSVPDIQISTGAELATRRNRSSLSIRFWWARLRSLISSTSATKYSPLPWTSRINEPLHSPCSTFPLLCKQRFSTPWKLLPSAIASSNLCENFGQSSG